jgi:hypothetical protein
MKRLLDYDPMTQVAVWHDYDSVTDKTTISEVQNCRPSIERGKMLQKEEAYTRKGIKNSFQHAATIPIGVQYEWLRRYGVNIFDKNHIKRVESLLNDPEWMYLRTTTGKVSLAHR